MIRTIRTSVAVLALSAGQASASVIAHVFEDTNGSGGTDVVATFSGALDLSMATPSFSYGNNPSLSSYSGRQFTITSGMPTFSRPYSQTMSTTGTTTKDGNALTNSDFFYSSTFSKSLTGGTLDPGSTDFYFFVSPGYTGYNISADYVSGSQFSGGMRFADSTLLDLGLTPNLLGTFVANFATHSGTQSISLTLGGSGPVSASVNAVPLPAGLPMFLGAFGVAVFVARRKRATKADV